MKHTTAFTVFPEHANHMYPIIFGGKFMAELDLAAAIAVRRFLVHSETAFNSVTHKASFEFHKPCYVGDLIEIEALIKQVGSKSLTVSVVAKRGESLIATAEFVFISVGELNDLASKPEYLPYVNHGLTADVQ